jgi:DNA-binding IclR family transcriptional regulator
MITELSRSLGETVDLSVLKGSAAVFIDQVAGSQRLRAVSAIGEAFPLHCTANGKALLALLAPDKRQRLLRAPLTRHTPATSTRLSAVLADIESGRARGYALDEEEYTEGISAVGTAFLDPMARPVAISIPVPTARFKRRRKELVESLLASRRRIVDAL